MKSILIVGGTGFVGRHLVKTAKENNLDVTSISLKESSSKKEDGVKYFYIDTTQPSQVSSFFKEKKFNYIVNLGGYVDHTPFHQDGIDVFYNHLNSLNNLFVSTLIHARPEAFIQVGSSDEYGLINYPQSELLRENPISPYSLSKVTASHLSQIFFREYNYPCFIIRPFIIFGPGQKENRLIPYVIKSCINDKEFPISSGKQKRDFLFVEDFTNAILEALKIRKIHGEIINIGSGKATEVKELVEKIKLYVGKGRPSFGSYQSPKKENECLVADLSKMSKFLTWRPQFSLDEAIKITIDSYMSL